MDLCGPPIPLKISITIFGADPKAVEYGSGSITDLLFEINTNASELPWVTANGLLAVVTIDTTGFLESPPEGHWELIITDTLNWDTELLQPTTSADPIPLDVTDGTVSIPIPEPATLALLLSFLGGLPVILALARRCRKRQP